MRFLLFPFIFLLFPGIKFANAEQINFDTALYYYFNSEPEKALVYLSIIEKENKKNPVFYEYKARCYWEIMKKMAEIQTTGYREREYVNINKNLEELFIENVDRAILISQSQFEENPSPENTYNLAMAITTKAGCIAQIYGKDKIIETAKLMDRAVTLAKACINQSYCLGYLPLGGAQYFITKEIASFSIRRIGFWFIRNEVPNLYWEINYNKDEAILFVELASECKGSWFRQEEALMLLQEFLMGPESNLKKRLEYSSRALPILKKLAEKYPNNKRIGENLFLAKRHVEIK